MPAIQSLTLTYDALNELGTFSEGDTLSGRVTMVLSKETTVESFFVKAKGDAQVRWTKKSGDHTHTYSSRRRYFKLKQFLVPESSNETVLPQGTHVYKFSFNIPTTSMPSTFKGCHGKIVYKLEAKLSRSWRMNRTLEKEINFVSKSFTNMPTLMSRQVGTADKEMGFFSKGSVHMEASVDRAAYTPGETAMIVAKINNSSSSEMTPKFSFIQEVTYRANGQTKHENRVIEKMVDNCLRSRMEKELRCAIKIPHNLEMTVHNCEILSVMYHFKVYLDISFAFDPEIIFPVIICHPDIISGPQPGASGAFGGPSSSDFPPSAVPSRCSSSPHSGSYRYPAAQGYSAVPPAYPANPPPYAGPPGMYAAQPTPLGAGYGNPASQQPSPYGSPFSSSSSSPVIHPPPNAPPFHPPPFAQPPQPSPSAPPAFNISSTAPAYSLPTAPLMNSDFLSQSDEAPPAYSLLFPSSDSETANAGK